MSESVVINCSCGATWEYQKERFYSLIFNHRTQGLACDCCNKVPNIGYGGLEA